MKRIALVVPDLELGGGVPAVTYFVHRTLTRSGRYSCILVSLATSATDTASRLLLRPRTWRRPAGTSAGKWSGWDYVHVGADWAELEFQRYRPRDALAEVLKDADLIQVVSGTPAWGYAVFGLGKPVSIHCATRSAVERRRRDANPRTVKDLWRRAMTKITARIDDDALRRADAVLLMNSHMHEYATRINRNRDALIATVAPGVDSVAFSPCLRRLASDTSYILCVGRFDDPRKNVELLLQAYALMPTGLRGARRLVLAGQRPPPREFWTTAKDLGVIDSVDHVDRPSRERLVELYRHACLFALPSDEEGFGMVLLEAMACGIPVISTRSGGPDGIITDGDDGFLTPLNDPRALCDRIVEICVDQQLNLLMGQKARLTVEKRYSEDSAGQILISVWDRLLAEEE